MWLRLHQLDGDNVRLDHQHHLQPDIGIAKVLSELRLLSDQANDFLLLS